MVTPNINNTDIPLRINRVKEQYDKAIKEYIIAVEGMKNWTYEGDSIIYTSASSCSHHLFSGIEVALRLFLESKGIQNEEIRNLATLCNLAGESPECDHIELTCFVENKEPRNQSTHMGRLVELSEYTRVIENFKKLLLLLNPQIEINGIQQIENVFSFTEFYEAMKEFKARNSKYMLICDPIHDVKKEYMDLLLSINWNIILDFDGRSSEGGLRSVFSEMDQVITYDIKNLRNSGINETIFKLNKKIHLLMEEGTVPRLYREWSRNLNDKNNIDYFAQKSYSIETPKLIIVCLKEYNDVLHLVLEKFIDHYGFENVSINFVSGNYSAMEQKDLEEKYDSCNVFNGSIPQVLASFDDYSHVFPKKEEGDYQEGILLPGREGTVVVENTNLIDNVAMYFEILDLKKGKSADVACNEEEFLKGNHATWEILNASYDVLPVEEKRYDRFKNQIKSALGTKDSNKLFYIEHKPGFGGTTLSRRLAWDIHKDNPVLVMERYENISTISRINDLYDFCKNGILILVDENTISKNDIEKFENAIKNIDRPVAALIVKRSKNELKADDESERNKLDNNVLELNLISKTGIDNFVLKCKSLAYRKYDRAIVDERERKMRTVLKGEMLCPLIIGLYFLEEEFIGIEEYVGRFINNLKDNLMHNTLKKAMRIIAICDYFGQKSVYSSIIEKIINTASLPSTRFDLEEEMKDVKDLFIFDTKKNVVQSVKARHYLISKEIMKQLFCDEDVYRFHKDAWKDYLKQYSTELIDLIVSMSTTKLDDALRDLITDIFIDNRDQSPDGSEDLDGDFSLLIETIPSEVERIDTLEYLTNTFNKHITNHIEPKTGFKEYQMLAHLWGHLARYYSKKGTSNHEKAEECCRESLNILDKIGSHDYIIYHIYGDCLYRKAKAIYDKLTSDDIKSDDLTYLKDLIDQSSDYYEKTIIYGNTEYGTTSQLRLLVDFLRVIFNIYGVETVADIKKIEEKWIIGYISKVGDIIENTETTDFSERTKTMYLSWKRQFEGISYKKSISQIIMELNNYLDELNNKPIKDTESIRHTRKALINTLLKKYESDLSKLADKKNSDDVTRILDLIKQNINTGNKYSIYDYSLWFKIVRYSEVPVSETIVMARRWYKFQQDNNHLDPNPAYYLYVLHYLRALDGFTDAVKEAKNYQKECLRICSEKKKYEVINETKIRDWFGKGKGMSRIIDDRTIEYSRLLEEPRIYNAKGKFIEMDPGGKGISGYLEIQDPIQLKGEKVFFRPIDCGLTSLQIGKQFYFKFGFSFERLVAFNNSVSKDGMDGSVSPAPAFPAPSAPSGPLCKMRKIKENDVVDFKIVKYLERHKLLVGDIEGTNFSGGVIVSEVSYNRVTDFELQSYVGTTIKAKILRFDEQNQKYRLSIKQVFSADDSDQTTLMAEKLRNAMKNKK